MGFLEKLDFMMERYGLNKRSLSLKSDIPYTTIDNWYKRGYDGIKLETLKKLSGYFNTLIDFWVLEDVTDPNFGKTNSFSMELEETQHIIKYRLLDPYGKEAVDSVLDVESRRCEAQGQTRTRLDIAAEVASYQTELELQEQVGDGSSAFNGQNGTGAKGDDAKVV